MERKRKAFRLYVHIPFCMKKCAYCDFLSWRGSREEQERYVQALCREIDFYKGRYPERVSSLFLGGGTPSVLDPRLLDMIMDRLTGAFSFEEDPEISIEVNPGTVTLERLRDHKKMGIDRISFGLQSTNDIQLERLGRIHTYREFLEGYDMARRAGFENINVDLMSGIPGQTLESWRQDLIRVTELEPEHISAYSLIIEEGTPFAQMDLDLPGEDEERDMYEATAAILGEKGYIQYEISNYARPGRACAHNIGYWRRDDYLGLGLGAASLVDGVRFRNSRSLSEYLAGDTKAQEAERLTRREELEETMFLGLRKTEGVKLTGELLEAYEDVFARLRQQGLLLWEEGRVRLTDLGFDVSNYALAEFL